MTDNSGNRELETEESAGAAPHPAILLVGATGMGKSPLGDFLEELGLGGRRMWHFDFGSNLRGVGAGQLKVDTLDEADLDLIRRVLTGGALLENRDFHVAAKILQAFEKRNRLAAGDWLVMNGLPRHVNQARDVDRLVDIRMVVFLDGGADVVRARIASNSGGDRTGRDDDSAEAVNRKLAIFRERTMPILDHYRAKKVSVQTFPVKTDTTPRRIVEWMEAGGLAGM